MKYMKLQLVLSVVTMIEQRNFIIISKAVVDYGQAHAEKYGHDRYGRTYTGVMPEWQPGQKFI